MRIFNIGDQVWIARVGLRAFFDPCTVCYGNLSVVVILGNGEHVSVPCSYCGPSIEPPSGTETNHRIEPGVESIVVAGRNISEGTETTVIYLDATGRSYRPEVVFETEEEALAESKKLCEQELEERQTRAVYIKKNQLKSFAWNAGYHRREAKRLRENISYHERMAQACKDREPKVGDTETEKS